MFGTLEQRKNVFEIWDKYLQNTYPSSCMRIEQLIIFWDVAHFKFQVYG